MATVKDAFDLTTHTIDRRARAYRNLVVLISIIGIVAVLWAAISWSGRPLLMLVSLLPLCSGFLVLDSVLVNRWRDRVMRLWVEDDLDLNLFASSVAAIRILPANTLRAMLASLPCDKQVTVTGELTRPVKEALAITASANHRAQTELTIIAAISHLLAVIFFTWAIFTWDWHPLLGCLIIVAFRLAGDAILSWRFRRRLRPHLVRWQAEGIDFETAISGSFSERPAKTMNISTKLT
jgi:hypothetical protein